ncbi:MAG: polyisoprenoid-binding protein [Acidobacteria bacterium]|nr:MAG: polyisoprenoid-binding protein [Acidobacteriota bacterium]
MTKGKALLLALILALPATVSAAPKTFEVDPAHSSVVFKIRHLLTNVTGKFKEFHGTIVYDAEDPSGSSVEFTVEAKSIDTGVAKRDGHLRSPDFFDVARYPAITFKSKKVAPGKDGMLLVTGDLTLHGVTKEITVPVEVLGVIDSPFGVRAGFETHFTIDRQDFGINWNKALDQGGVVLGNEVAIEISVEAAAH